ncbi:MAG: hypothetical protein ABI891_15840 [Acidobacteriota bacterium]
MNENFEPNEQAEIKKEPEMIVNNYGSSKDDAVVIEEETRTVLLTEDETIVFEKEPRIDIVPKNRPRKVYAGMWGSLEIATVGLGMLAILAVIILVVLVVLPAQKQLEADKAKRDQLETELISSRGKYGTITTTEARVAELINSANDFESNYLRAEATGKTELYQRLNGFISAYNLTNTSGPDYAPLEIADNSNNKNEAERGREKFQSIFPGVYVTTTVEGSYQNLRRFIREMETSNQFVVISAVELQPAENKEKNDTNTPTQASINTVTVNPTNEFGVPQNPVQQTVSVAPQTKAVRGKTHGETVTLRLEMAAYFRRPNFQPTEVEVSTQ